MNLFTKVAVALSTFAFPSLAQANIQASPASPPLDPAFCAGGMAPTSNSVWSGEMRAWGGATRPMVKVELQGGAICNDGSPAVIYVRPAPSTLADGTSNPLIDAYHIHLKGGGSCRSFAECQKRWCSDPSLLTNKPGLMSSLGYAPAIEGTGMFADRTNNRFAMANQVIAAYCSSDSWIGSTPAGHAISVDPNDNPAAVSSIAFMGHEIIMEMLQSLDGGLVVSKPGSDATFRFRPLTSATHILMTGDSAGASGVRFHLDMMTDRYPNAITIGALDAGGSIDMQDPILSWAQHPTASSYDQMMDDKSTQMRAFHGVLDAALDQSCLFANPGGAAAQRPCFDGYALQRYHVTTPVLQRTSQADSVMLSSGFLNMLPTGSPVEMRQLSYDNLLAATVTNANLSALSPHCTRHVTFRNNQQFRDMRIIAPGPRLFREVQNWVSGCFSGLCPKIVHMADPIAPNSSVCP